MNTTDQIRSTVFQTDPITTGMERLTALVVLGEQRRQPMRVVSVAGISESFEHVRHADDCRAYELRVRVRALLIREGRSVMKGKDKRPRIRGHARAGAEENRVISCRLLLND